MEVLTDRPATWFRRGAVVHPEGRPDVLTVVTATPVEDGPGWRISFREVADRTAAEALRGTYLDVVVGPATALGRGEYYWHEVIGTAVRGIDGAELGSVRDVYRVGETEVFAVDGGPHGEFDVPAIRTFIRVFAPRRGEIVVDAESLGLGDPPVPPDPDRPRPRAPRRRSRRGAGRADPASPSPAGDTVEPGEAASGSDVR